MTQSSAKFSIWRKHDGKYHCYDCELTEQEVKQYRNSDYWFVQEDTGTEWPYEYRKK